MQFTKPGAKALMAVPALASLSLALGTVPAQAHVKWFAP